MNNFILLHGRVGYLDEALLFFVLPPIIIILISAWRRGTKRKTGLELEKNLKNSFFRK